MAFNIQAWDWGPLAFLNIFYFIYPLIPDIPSSYKILGRPFFFFSFFPLLFWTVDIIYFCFFYTKTMGQNVPMNEPKHTKTFPTLRLTLYRLLK